MNKFLILTFINFVLITAQEQFKIDTYEDWLSITGSTESTSIMKSLDVGGEFDLMGNGALLLSKNIPDSLFALSDNFSKEGIWESGWKTFETVVDMKKLKCDLLYYGRSLDVTKGWEKYSGNPVLSGANSLLPLNKNNITDQTILLPEPPGGVPQDQSIVKGKGIYEGKWILFFNHTPKAWPKNYYWSIAVADSLSPLRRGINPFSIPKEHYPLFGPINNQAPNDWIEINGRYYAPDETYQSMAHLWISDDLFTWRDLGVIENKTGTDPGIVYDGVQFHLFSENVNTISHCFFDVYKVMGSENRDVLYVGDHTGDADVSFFNNQWHMFVDDGEHLKYKISYAVTTPEEFPYGWKLIPEIYGPHNPEQGQKWDDDSKEGNDFGTGDADIALEDDYLYLFTERPVGAAYKKLSELFTNSPNQSVEVEINVDKNNDGTIDDNSGWIKLDASKDVIDLPKTLSGNRFKVRFKLSTKDSKVSPLIRKFILF